MKPSPTPPVFVALLLLLVSCATQTTPPAPENTLPALAQEGTPEQVYVSDPFEYRRLPLSAESGASYFNDIGIGDPYAAGIPYPVFLALQAMYPDKLGRDWHGFNARFGTLPNIEDPNDPKRLPVGFHLTEDPITGVDFLVMNCALCHAERLRLPEGDRVISGLGNKRLRIHAYADAIFSIAEDERLTATRLATATERVAKKKRLMWPKNARSLIVDGTLRSLRARAALQQPFAPLFRDAKPGRVATIEGFALATQMHYGTQAVLGEHVGWAKIPDVVVAPFRTTNSFDGVTTGAPVALASWADFVFGVRPQWYDTHRHISTSVYLHMKTFSRQLPFPGHIDMPLARQGYAHFDRACAGCHGTYGSPDALHRVPGYREQVIPHDHVGTDRTRADAMTAAMAERANDVAITQGLLHTAPSEGYVPRPLNQVWARGLYGHNGQWPDLHVLALSDDQRPRRFVVHADATYNLDRVGTPWSPLRDTPTGTEIMRDGAWVPLELQPGEYLYDAAEPGFGVQGHPFLSDLDAERQRAILEYLKTL